MADPDNVNFRSTIHEFMDEVAETYGVENNGGEIIIGDALILELGETSLDFNTGRVIGELRIETRHHTTYMLCEEMRVGNATIDFIGREDDTRASVFIGSNWDGGDGE